MQAPPCPSWFHVCCARRTSARPRANTALRAQALQGTPCAHSPHRAGSFHACMHDSPMASMAHIGAPALTTATLRRTHLARRGPHTAYPGSSMPHEQLCCGLDVYAWWHLLHSICILHARILINTSSGHNPIKREFQRLAAHGCLSVPDSDRACHNAAKTWHYQALKKLLGLVPIRSSPLPNLVLLHFQSPPSLGGNRPQPVTRRPCTGPLQGLL